VPRVNYGPFATFLDALDAREDGSNRPIHELPLAGEIQPQALIGDVSHLSPPFPVPRGGVRSIHTPTVGTHAIFEVQAGGRGCWITEMIAGDAFGDEVVLRMSAQSLIAALPVVVPVTSLYDGPALAVFTEGDAAAPPLDAPFYRLATGGVLMVPLGIFVPAGSFLSATEDSIGNALDLAFLFQDVPNFGPGTPGA